MHERHDDPQGDAAAGRVKATAIMAVAMVALSAAALSGCSSPLEIRSGSVELSVEAGPGWMHKHPLFLGLSMYTPPQIAIWVEDLSGNYLGTLYVARKSATQAWLPSVGEGLAASEIRRPEALPAWSHRRGVVYADGLYMPTSSSPVVDAVTSATPKEGFSLAMEAAGGLRQFRIMAEVNQSLDFNTAYPAEAAKDSAGYSGGAFGSGQPSLVYAADIDLDSAATDYLFSLLGHGSADGSDGSVDTDVSGISDATDIMGRMTARVVK